MTDFVHLHVHSDFSLLDGAVSVNSLVDKAQKLGMSHIALTDHGNMFGAMNFLKACEETVNEKSEDEDPKKPVKPIIGCEVYISPGSRFDGKETEKENENRYYHFILLAKNRTGYFNLVKLCSFAYTEGFYYRPRIDEELLAQYHEGLIGLSACVSGEIPRLIQDGRTGEAEEKARHYRDLFGTDEKGNPDFYLEIQDHGIPAERLRGSLSQRDINRAIAGIALRTGIPLVATNDVHYLNREDNIAHDVLLCIGTAQNRDDEKRRRQYYGEEYYLKTGDEMAGLFPEYPEAISNTVRIAERCDADIRRISGEELSRYLPEFKIPVGYVSADEYLRHLAVGGLDSRYPEEYKEAGERWNEIKNRLEYELGIIVKMGFAGYFLIVADFIKWAKENGVSVGPGRGSGAGSVTAFSLHITDIDPFRYGLLFERFLNPERISMPDFDVDFEKAGRDSVIRYVTEKYGREQVGQIITFGTLKAKAVIKDVARVLGISLNESEMITKLIPDDPKITLEKALETEPRMRELEQNSRYTELFFLAKKLEGLNRQSGIHASGVVIGKVPLHNLVPLYRDSKSGAIATQFDMDHLEKCGLVKMDFLGLKTLDVIKNTENLISRRGGEYTGFSVSEMPEDDAATFRMLGEGQSFGLFQFESDGMQDILRRAKPDKIEDLIALNALYRPGPMAYISKYVDSKNGRQKISYPDPCLEDVLKETYGVIVYQEQVMHVARIIAGYSMGHADLLRRAMGKKKKEIIDKEKIPFIEGALKQGFTREKASQIYDILVPFGDYGFNKSHAAGYAVMAYRTAYLKAHFPTEFMAASLSNKIYSSEKDGISGCIAEARKLGLVIDPPDINKSRKLFDIIDGRIVYGLLGIKGLGELAADEIVNCRQDGPYRDLIDFLTRVDIRAVGKSVIEKLIQTGAFDKLDVKRDKLLGNLERAIEHIQSIKDEKKFGQVSLFENTGEKEFPDFKFENYPETVREEKFKLEKELIGFYISGHPLDEYKEIWKNTVKADLGHPGTLVSGSQILLGLIKNIKTIPTSKGDKMAFATLEDFNGEMELTLFSDAWGKCGDKIENGKVAILRGKIDYQANKDRYSFIVDESLDLEDLKKAVKEEDALARRWDKYRNVWKYAKELDLEFPDLGNVAKIEPGVYSIIGTIKSLRNHIDKKGKDMAFGTIMDYRGEINLVFFARTWENCKAIVAVDEIVALKGTIDPRSDNNPQKPSFKVSSILDLNRLVRLAAKRVELESTISKPLEDASTTDAGNQASFREIHIRLSQAAANDETSLYSLLYCLEKNPGICQIYIHVPDTADAKVSAGISNEKIILAAENVAPGVFETIRAMDSVAEVWSV